MDTLPTPHVADFLAVAVVVLITIRGHTRGLSGEVAQLAGLVIAFLFGLQAHPVVTLWLLDHTRLEGQSAHAVAFVAAFLAAVAAMLLVRYLLRFVMRVVIEEKFDKAAGSVAAFLRACILVTVVFLVMNLWPHEYLNRTFGEDSLIGTIVMRQAAHLVEKVEERAAERSAAR